MSEKLEITKLLAAPAEEVFRAWTDPQMMSKWFAPGSATAQVPELDVRPGGRFRVIMTDPSGPVHTVQGEYREVQANAKLVFTWRWEGSDWPETRVTVELNPQGDKTELVLSHDGFPSAEVRDRHVHGWSGSTGKLEELMASEQ